MVVLKRDVSCASLVLDQAWDLGLEAQPGLGPYLLYSMLNILGWGDVKECS